MIEQGYTLDSSEYYDDYLNKAAITLNYADQTVTLIYSYGTNELFTITGNHQGQGSNMLHAIVDRLWDMHRGKCFDAHLCGSCGALGNI